MIKPGVGSPSNSVSFCSSYHMELKKGLLFFLLLEYIFCINVESKCVKECDLALASYYVYPGNSTLSYINSWMESSVLSSSEVITSYNKDKIVNDNVPSFNRLNIPFPCDCIDDEFLGHMFEYSAAAGDTYDSIAKETYANLTTVELLMRFNSYGHDIPANAKINVTVKCFCGNSQVSKDYGLFITYPLRPGNNLHDIANEAHLDAQLLERYNPGVNFSKESGIVFIPGRDQEGDYVPMYPRKTGLAKGAAIGISIAGICGLLLFVVCIYVRYFHKKEGEKAKLSTESSMVFSTQDGTGSSGPTAASATGLTGIMVAKSMEFSYQELSKATNNFSLENKIGQGGFGAVYYAELRGEVRLIGYCVEGSLFLVYEYIDNGNLGQYLHGTGKDPLPWSSRVQIALDSARGLEYIHEHTVPVYIHRDVKSANILIDKNFRGKVADFGLTKLIEVGGSTLHTRLVGTFGYMPPEYAQYGDVSPKVDVYAFGVVLYELISAKNAILKTGESVAETKGLVALFEEALNQRNPAEGIRKLVDPRLGENYPVDSVLKIAQLGRACTRDNPLLRPSMRSIVVALMTLSSPSEDCEDDTSYENQTLINLLENTFEAYMEQETKWVIQINEELKSNDDTSEHEKKQWKRHSIYKIPTRVTELNKKAYKPQAVSFGPYHHGEEHLKEMEHHKHRSLIHFLKRCKKPVEMLYHCMNEVVQELRDSYNPLDPIWMQDTPRFVQMMIVDGCFMLEVLRTNHDSAPNDYADNDPVFGQHGKLHVVPYIKRDMLMLENQLPFMVLRILIQVETDNNQVDEWLIKQIINFFSPGTTPEAGNLNVKCKHVLDLYRRTLIQQGPTHPTRVSSATKLWKHGGGEIIRSATELQDAGIRFRKSRSRSLSDVSFMNGVLRLPALVVDDTTEYMLLNLMAFERLHAGAGNEVTAYVFFMDTMIDGEMDVAVLHRTGIVVNALGSDKAVAKLFNSLSRDVAVDGEGCVLDVVRMSVSNYCQKPWNIWRANLIHTYFRNPWAVVSLVAAVFLFALTIVQTVYTIAQFYQPPAGDDSPFITPSPRPWRRP
ncbi:hypothetical protein Fmac_030854 [Flemingia macrophylla]|uniref:Protein kinase domain-containing protein n=1 Tax=Flemingia macrophylla TaxID=520843 RepID=A0ABD1L0D8_9FABA